MNFIGDGWNGSKKLGISFEGRGMSPTNGERTMSDKRRESAREQLDRMLAEGIPDAPSKAELARRQYEEAKHSKSLPQA